MFEVFTESQIQEVEVPYSEYEKFIFRSQAEEVDPVILPGRKAKKNWRRVRVFMPGGEVLRLDRKLAMEMGVWPTNIGNQQVCLWSSYP